MRTGLGQFPEQAILAPGAEARPGVMVAASTKEIPYDYVAKFELAGVFGNRVQDVINVSVDGAFVAVAIGYSFLPLRDGLPPPSPPESPMLKGRERIRNRRVALKTAIGTGTIPALLPLLTGLSSDRNVACLEELLRALSLRAQRLDFLYQVIDSASGRELQNQPIHNLAGLGNAEGDRPFRMFAKPMLFQPRSSIRIEIIEQSQCPFFEGGQLYFVLHGYKLLGFGVPSS